MKLLRFGMLALIVCFAATSLPLRAHAAEQPKSAAMPTMQSPQDMAKAAVAKWKTTLKLTDAQVPQFEQIMTDSYQKMADAKTAAAGDKAKMKASMTSIMKDRDDALAKVLTPEQMKMYREKMHHMASKAKKHMEATSK